MSSLERLGEAGWLPDVRSEESLAAPPAPGVKPAQPTAVQQLCRFGEAWAALRAENLLTYLPLAYRVQYVHLSLVTQK